MLIPESDKEHTWYNTRPFVAHYHVLLPLSAEDHYSPMTQVEMRACTETGCSEKYASLGEDRSEFIMWRDPGVSHYVRTKNVDAAVTKTEMFERIRLSAAQGYEEGYEAGFEDGLEDRE